MQLKRFTLLFDPENERQFHDANWEREAAVTAKIARVFAGAVACVSIYRWIVDQAVTPSRFVEAFLVTLGIAYGPVSRTAVYRRFSHHVGTLMLVGSILALVVLSLTARPHRLPYVTGVYYMHVMLIALVPLRLVQKVVLCAVSLGSFLIFAWLKDVYTKDIFGLICSHFAIAFIITTGSCYVIERARRDRYILEVALKKAQDRADGLLRNMLPESVAERFLAEGDDAQVVERFERVAVLFADIVGFTPLAAEKSPEEIVRLLDDLFSRFDALAARLGVEKIKTIGDAYMAVAGAPNVVEDPEARVVELALEMRDAVTRYAAITKTPIEVRIGVHAGPVVAGVIGRRRFVYDLWGDTVNIAARLETAGEPGRVHVSADIFRSLESRFQFEPRGRITLKGRGAIESYFVAALAERASVRPQAG